VIADQTDGRAIVGRNDPLPELRQMLRDTSAYYLLGYTSTEAPRDGKFHEIKVSIKRKGVELRSRKGYWAMSPDDVERAAAPAKPVLAADLAEALASVSEPERGHPVRTWVGFDRAEDGRSMVTLVWETAPNVAAADAPEQLSVVANFVTGDLLFRGKVARDPQALKPSGRVSFPSKPGAMRLRLTAESASGQLIDSELRELVVPDYTKVGPTATPPLVFRAQNARELQQIRQSTSALPTTARDIARTEQLLIRFKTYGPGGTPPAVTMRLLNAVGDTMSTFPPPERKADGSYDVPFSLGGLDDTGPFQLDRDGVEDRPQRGFLHPRLDARVVEHLQHQVVQPGQRAANGAVAEDGRQRQVRVVGQAQHVRQLLGDTTQQIALAAGPVDRNHRRRAQDAPLRVGAKTCQADAVAEEALASAVARRAEELQGVGFERVLARQHHHVIGFPRCGRGFDVKPGNPCDLPEVGDHQRGMDFLFANAVDEHVADRSRPFAHRMHARRVVAFQRQFDEGFNQLVRGFPR
jgi:hypothetical protein